MRRLRFARPAERDLADILARSLGVHVEAAAQRYDALLRLAFADLAERPDRPSVRRGRDTRLRLYALRHPARRLTGDAIVRAPPHVVVFRYDDEIVRILRILHEAMDLPPVLNNLDHARR